MWNNANGVWPHLRSYAKWIKWLKNFVFSCDSWSSRWKRFACLLRIWGVGPLYLISKRAVYISANLLNEFLGLKCNRTHSMDGTWISGLRFMKHSTNSRALIANSKCDVLPWRRSRPLSYTHRIKLECNPKNHHFLWNLVCHIKHVRIFVWSCLVLYKDSYLSLLFCLGFACCCEGVPC